MTKLSSKFCWEEKADLDQGAVAQLARVLGIPDAGARFLVSRGTSTPEAAGGYLFDDGVDLHDPFQFEHMERAVELVRSAIATGKRILIHGDYDVDGICGTALLYEFLYGLVPHVFRFLPDRRKDGYGIAARGVAWAIEHDVGLFIAVDCGTSDGPNIERLEDAGVDVVVCDHHEFPLDRPARGVMLNPVRDGESYPFEGLCGAGVAFKLVHALEERGVRGKRTGAELLDLVALATVGDVAPLVDENRLLVRQGLAVMNRGGRPGVVALRNSARLETQELTATHIGFNLAPRLNAPGRISNPKSALQILCATERLESEKLARTLEKDNEHRRTLTEQVKTEALRNIEQMRDREDCRAFVLSGKSWDEGVLGIAAARVAEDFGKPTLLISTSGETAKGSGRSVPGVHLKRQLDRCGSFLERFGGHAQAVGFSMDPDNIEGFRQEFSRQLGLTGADLPKKPRLRVDTDLAVGEASTELTDFLGMCEPFGRGNRNPVWKISSVTVETDTRWVGNGHLKIFFRDGEGRKGKGICFNWDTRSVAPEVLHGRVLDMAVKLKKGYYRGRHYAEIQVVDVREGES